MAANNRQYIQASRVVTLLQAETFADNIKSDEVRQSEDFLRTKSPARGIHVVPLQEEYATGMAGKDDVRYRCLVVRVMPSITPESNELRSKFRYIIRETFHNQRIMDEGCEIITKTRPGEWKIPRPWLKSNLDITAFEIRTLIRELRGS